MKKSAFAVFGLWRKDRFVQMLLLLLLTVTFIAYLPSLWNNFVDFDDVLLIGENAFVHQLSLQNLYAAFTSYDPELYIPLTFVSYMLEYAFVGTSPFLYHFDSLLLHLLSTILVAMFVVLATERKRDALIVAALFALHPMQVEAVAWIAARKDVLSAFFFLATLCTYLLYCKNHKHSLYALCVCLFTLGLLAKVSIVTLPLCLLLLDWLRGRSIRLRWRVAELAPFFLIAGIFLGVAWYGKHGILSSLQPLQLLMISLRVPMFIASGVVYPFHFSVLYLLPSPLNIFSADFVLPAACTIIISLVSLFSIVRQKARLIVFGWWFFLLCLAPSMTNISKAGELYLTSDRYSYIASIGLFLIVAAFVRSFMHRYKHGQFIAKRGGAIIVALLALLTCTQSLLWRDSKTLFTHAVALYPQSAVAHSILGNASIKRGDNKTALQEYAKALAIRPDLAKSYTPLAMLYQLQGDAKKAEELLLQAIRIDPQDATTLSEMGLLEYNRGNNEKAIEYYERSLRNGSKRFNLSKRVATYNNLAAAYAKQKLYDKEIEQYEQALLVDPNFYFSYYNMAASYTEQGKDDKAFIALKKAVEINPAFTDAHMSLARLYTRQNAWSDALSEAEIVRRLQPDYPDIDVFIRVVEEKLGMVSRNNH
ncbi:MAG: tetratricopeptide repeat protein [Candidatus Peribacteraceae bacterium]|nr:tetratricopeptide repeat protein [Candidatus Peribacteraceae bacterium]